MSINMTKIFCGKCMFEMTYDGGVVLEVNGSGTPQCKVYSYKYSCSGCNATVLRSLPNTIVEPGDPTYKSWKSERNVYLYEWD